MTALMEVRDLSRRFGGLDALKDVSFTLNEGEIKAIIGPNGAGKTTLFNVLSGVTPPSAGEVRYRGRRIDQEPVDRRVAAGMVRTFQNLQIFKELTVLENAMVGGHVASTGGFLASMLRLPGIAREEARLEALALGQLARLGLAERAYDKAGDLSFGECKILEIARALLSEPKLLMLDEPIAGLPHDEIGRVADTIRKINAEGITVVLVEHNMRMVMALAHSILVLNHGRPIAEGTPDHVRRDPAVLEAYLGRDDDDA